MKESVAIAKDAAAEKGFSPARSGNSIHRVRNEPERQLGSLRAAIGNIRRDGGTPSVESIATELSSMPVAQRASVLLALQRTHGNQYVQRVVTGIQAKLKVGQPGDIYEQEADRVAEQVMRMPEPQVQRQPEEEEEEEELIQTKPLAGQITQLLQRQVEEEKEEILQTKKIEDTTPEVTHDLESRIHAIQGGGQPLSESVRAFFEPRFGYDFSYVRVHTDAHAAESAQALNARAYTVGRDVVFGTGQYAPETRGGKGVLAHELTHIVQQRTGRTVPKAQANNLILKRIEDSAIQRQVPPSECEYIYIGKIISPPPEKRPISEAKVCRSFATGVSFNDPSNCPTSLIPETEVRVIEETKWGWFRICCDGIIGFGPAEQGFVHSAFVKQLEPPKAGEPAPSASSIHVGIIPIAEFIKHIEVIERSYPSKSPKEILTMIRSLYYGSPAGSPGFDRLIPDAPNTGAVQTCTDSEGSLCKEPVGTCMCVYAHGLSMDTSKLQAAVRRLHQRANENEIADNPSPYIQVGNDVIDIGHVLVGVDAILHPRTTAPFSSHGLISAPGPATWVGDIGAAMVFLKEHQKNGHKSDDVKGNPSATLEDYYKNSMPMSDLLGDVDAFGVVQMVGPQTLSTALRYYYVSESGGSPRFRYNRWRNFATANNLTYTEAGNKITWIALARQIVIWRTTQFANLFAGRKSPIRAMTIGIPPQQWDQAGAFANRFLQDVKHGLEEEITHNAVR